MENADSVSPSGEGIIAIGRVFFAVGLIGIGVQHFIFGNFIPVMVAWWPAWIPWRPLWAGIFGAILIISGSLIIFGKRPLAAYKLEYSALRRLEDPGTDICDRLLLAEMPFL